MGFMINNKEEMKKRSKDLFVLFLKMFFELTVYTIIVGYLLLSFKFDMLMVFLLFFALIGFMAFMEFVYFLIRKIYNKAVLNG
jgi:hypothetical protein